MEGDFENDQVVCVSHIDLDGHAAAAVVKRRYPTAKVYYSDYKTSLHPSAYQRGARLFVTDFSLADEEFTKARNIGMEIVWLDHHMDRVRQLEQNGMSFPGRRREDECGALLTWKFLYPALRVPRAIRLVDDIDRWQFKDPDTEAFAAGIQMYETRVSYRTCYIWDRLLSDDRTVADATLAQIIEDGQKILKYSKYRDAIMNKELSTIVDYNGKKILVAGVKLHNSMFFETTKQEVKDKVDAMCLIQFNPRGCYKGTFYSPDDKREVLPMAKALGGGGHPCAAGFTVTTVPFEYQFKPEPINIDKILAAYQRLAEMRKSLIVDRAACKSDRISLSGSTYHTTVFGQRAIAINHPYITELIRALPYFVELKDPSLNIPVTMACSWVRTGSGWYRNGIVFLDKSAAMTPERIVAQASKLDPAVFEVATEETAWGGQTYWFYSKLPIIPQFAG